MSIQCEYCGVFEDSLAKNCANCGGVLTKKYTRLDKNQFLKKKFILIAIFFCLVIIFSSFLKSKTEWYSSAEYQNEFDKQAQSGYFPKNIIGKCDSGSEKFSSEWKDKPLGASFFSHYGIKGKKYFIEKSNSYISKGYYLYFSSKFLDCSNNYRYQGTWIKEG